MASSRLLVSNEVLPINFKNQIIETNQDSVTIRSNLTCMAEINEATNTKWNSRTSYPSGHRIVCSKKLVCHHSGFQKVPRDQNKKGISKNADCHSSIFIKVKLDTYKTRKVYDFVKDEVEEAADSQNENCTAARPVARALPSFCPRFRTLPQHIVLPAVFSCPRRLTRHKQDIVRQRAAGLRRQQIHGRQVTSDMVMWDVDVSGTLGIWDDNRLMHDK